MVKLPVDCEPDRPDQPVGLTEHEVANELVQLIVAAVLYGIVIAPIVPLASIYGETLS